MLCAAIDIGSNTTRLLVAELRDGALRKVAERRAYTRIGRAGGRDGRIGPAKAAEIAGAVATQVRLAGELGVGALRIVATAAIREAPNRDEVVAALARAAGSPVDVLGEREEGVLAFSGATRALAQPPAGEVGVVDVGGGSTEIVLGTAPDSVREVQSFRIGSGSLADELLHGDPPSADELRALRERIEEAFAGVEVASPEQAVAVGGSATSTGRLVGTLLEPETLERAVGVLAGAPIAEVARRFELDQTRVRLLPAGVLLLERVSRLLDRPLRIGEGGLREGIVLELAGQRASAPAKSQ